MLTRLPAGHGGAQVSVEQQGGWRSLLYGPNGVADLQMSVKEWGLKEQLIIYDEIRRLQVPAYRPAGC